MLDFPFRAASGRSVLVTFVLFLAAGFAIFQLGPYAAIVSAAPLPEESPGMSADGVHAFLERLGDDGRSRYVGFQAFDLLHALSLAGFASLLLAWILKRAGSANGAWRALPPIPLLVLGTEALENVLLAATASAWPDTSGTAGLVGGVTAAKFGAVSLMILALLLALGRRLRAAMAARRGTR